MSQQGKNEIERMIVKYRDKRRAEAGTTLELHKAARQRLHEAVVEEYGAGFVSAQESAEKFARTLAWQQNLGRWWHGLVPKIGFAGACFAAVMVVFSIAHREAQESSEPEMVSDFLNMTPLEETAAPAIIPEAALALDDAQALPAAPAASPGPAPLPPVVKAPSSADAGEVAPSPTSRPAQVFAMEPKPEPAEMMEDHTPAPSVSAGATAPVAKSALSSRTKVADPVWTAKPSSKIEVRIPNSLIEQSSVVSEPIAPPVAAVPMAEERRAAPVQTRNERPVAFSAPATSPSAVASGAPLVVSAAIPAVAVRARFVASRPQPMLRRFDVVLEGGTISIRDEDGSIYRGKTGPAVSGVSEFDARGRSRALREDVRIVGRLTLGEDASGGSVQSDVMLGDGRRFRVEADAR
jgi:hypothetical protein